MANNEYRTVSTYGPVDVEALVPREQNTDRDVTYMVSCGHSCRGFGRASITTRSEAETYAREHARDVHGVNA